MNPSPLNIKEQSFFYDQSVKINYEIYGRGEPHLVFFHGFGASRESWRDIVPLLGPGTFYLIDLKGQGLSSKPNDGRYSFTDHSKIISAFLIRERIESAVLVGHSYGGAVALMTYFTLRAQGQERRVRALALIDSAGYVQSLPFFVSLLQKPILNRIVLGLTPSTIRARYTLERLFFDRSKVDPERVERYAKYFDLPGAHGALIETAKQIYATDINDFVNQISTVSVPTLILWGENDPIIPVSIAQRLHNDIRGSTLVVLPNCGHIAQEEQPSATAETLKSFLNSIQQQ